MGDDSPLHIRTAEGVEITPAILALREYLESHSEQLLGILRSYVSKAGLGEGGAVEIVAMEVMSETIVEALSHPEKFDVDRSPQAWLLGIAINVLKRYRERQAQQHQRQSPISQLNITPDPDNALALFDKLASLNPRVFDEIAQENPENAVVNGEIEMSELAQLRIAWARLSNKEREVIQLGVQSDYSGEEMARILNINHGAARVRLHRAITRLSKLMAEIGGK